jgi:hypothetical protein
VPQPLTQTIGKPAAFSYLKNFTGDEQADLSQGKKIVALFNLGCDHCKEVALQMGIVYKNYPYRSAYIVFVGDKNDVPLFFQDGRINFPYKVLSYQEYFSVSGPWVPRVAIIEQGIIKYDWNYQSFKGTVFEQAIKAEKLGK